MKIMGEEFFDKDDFSSLVRDIYDMLNEIEKRSRKYEKSIRTEIRLGFDPDPQDDDLKKLDFIHNNLLGIIEELDERE
jgi:hypothetical protein